MILIPAIRNAVVTHASSILLPVDAPYLTFTMETDFVALQSAISAALVATTRSATALANEDLSFHRSLDASLASALDQQNERLLGLATGLLGTATATSETVRPPPSLRDVEGIENNWRAVVDVVDSLLERADTALDEFTGAVKRLSPSADVQVWIQNGTVEQDFEADQPGQWREDAKDV